VHGKGEVKGAHTRAATGRDKVLPARGRGGRRHAAERDLASERREERPETKNGGGRSKKKGHRKEGGKEGKEGRA
jgi:hypothetical protein